MGSISLQSSLRRYPAASFVCSGLITVVMASSALAVVIRHDRDLERTLELGQRYPYVGAAGGGSGTLVAPRWLLTAAHVVENFSPFDFRVRFGDREVCLLGNCCIWSTYSVKTGVPRVMRGSAG